MAYKLISALKISEAHRDADESDEDSIQALAGAELGNPGHWLDSIAADQKHLECYSRELRVDRQQFPVQTWLRKLELAGFGHNRALESLVGQEAVSFEIFCNGSVGSRTGSWPF